MERSDRRRDRHLEIACIKRVRYERLINRIRIDSVARTKSFKLPSLGVVILRQFVHTTDNMLTRRSINRGALSRTIAEVQIPSAEAIADGRSDDIASSKRQTFVTSTIDGLGRHDLLERNAVGIVSEEAHGHRFVTRTIVCKLNRIFDIRRFLDVVQMNRIVVRRGVIQGVDIRRQLIEAVEASQRVAICSASRIFRVDFEIRRRQLIEMTVVIVSEQRRHNRLRTVERVFGDKRHQVA